MQALHARMHSLLDQDITLESVVAMLAHCQTFLTQDITSAQTSPLMCCALGLALIEPAPQAQHGKTARGYGCSLEVRIRHSNPQSSAQQCRNNPDDACDALGCRL